MPPQVSKAPWRRSTPLDAGEINSRIERSVIDLQTATGRGSESTVQKAVENKSKPPIAVFTYAKSGSGRRTEPYSNDAKKYYSGQYDLIEIAKARDIESILQVAIERHVESARKKINIVGKDEKKVEYIKRRFWEMEILSGTTLRELAREWLDQLASYGTAIVVARRDEERSSGSRIMWFGKELKPISTLHTADAPTMSCGENQRGVVVSWKQKVYGPGTSAGDIRTFNGHDVFVMTRHKQPGMVFGRPPCISVLDDILSLRRLEDLLDIIPQKHLFPVFQVMVGNDAHPAGDMVIDGQTMSEIEYAQEKLEEMPTEGGFVTSHRWKFEVIGAKDEILEIMPYIDHFKWRVQVGLRMNDTIVGKSGDSTKSTATHQMKALSDSARYLQECVEDGIKPILRQLLQEGGFEEFYDDDVRIVFDSPDDEQDQASDNHAMALYQSDLVTHNEARKRMKKPPLTPEEMNQTYGAQEHARAQELEKVSASAKAAARPTSASVRNQPRNQHGTKKAKTRVKANDWVDQQ